MKLLTSPLMAPEGAGSAAPTSASEAHAAASSASSRIDIAELNTLGGDDDGGGDGADSDDTSGGADPASTSDSNSTPAVQADGTSPDPASATPGADAKSTSTFGTPAIDPNNPATWDADTRKIFEQYKNSPLELAKALQATKLHSLKQHKELEGFKAAPKPAPAAAPTPTSGAGATAPGQLALEDFNDSRRSEIHSTMTNLDNWANLFDANAKEINDHLSSIDKFGAELQQTQGRISYLEKKLQDPNLEEFTRDKFKSELADERLGERSLRMDVSRLKLEVDHLTIKNRTLKSDYNSGKARISDITKSVRSEKEARVRYQGQESERQEKASKDLLSALDSAMKELSVPDDAKDDLQIALLTAANGHPDYIEDLHAFFVSQGKFTLRMQQKLTAPGIRSYIEDKKKDAAQPAPTTAAPAPKASAPQSWKEAHKTAMAGAKKIPF